MPGQAIGVANPARFAVIVEQDDSPAVEAEQFRQQVQGLAQDDIGRKALPDEAHDLLHQQHFLFAPERGGTVRIGLGRLCLLHQ
jgi:hypothetical protein